MGERAVHQILVGAGGGDAITEMARRLRTGLRQLGPSEIYAHFLSPDALSDVRPLHELGSGRRDDLLVYHVSYGEPSVTRVLLSRPERLAIVYHNITPAEHFLAHDPHFAAGLHWGRHELEVLRDRAVLAVADSSYNAGELDALGYSDVHVIPAGLDPGRLAAARPDGAMARTLAGQFPSGFVLSVSQVLPHKRFETILQAMHVVNWIHEVPLGLVIIGPPRLPKYQRGLEILARRLNLRHVWFAGGRTDGELAAAFRLASMHVTASVHEGLALPPLEAMSFGVPVIARAAGAVAETVAGGGLVLPSSAGPVLLAEAISRVACDRELNRRMRVAGLARLRTLGTTDPSSRFVELVREAS